MTDEEYKAFYDRGELFAAIVENDMATEVAGMSPEQKEAFFEGFYDNH
jgi:hypothetical protein